METRVPPSERLRRELDEKLTGIESSDDPIEEVARLGARLIIQQAMEDEVTQFLGRGRYERSCEPVAYRNGYEPTTVRASSGSIELQRPRLRGAEGLSFESRIVGKGVARTHALETLVICWFCAGCRSATSRPRSRRPSTSSSSRGRPSRGSARTRASATGAGAVGASTSTTWSTCSVTRST